jgi:DNA-binding transcriptional LysR family regulator
MNTFHMKYFVDAAHSGSLRQSAELNNVTHSAVSLAIRTLEKELGVELLEHAKRRFRLTLEGERVRDQFANWLAGVEALKEQISVVSSEPSGTLNLIGAQSLMSSSMGEALLRFKKKYPQVQIKLSTGPSAAVHAALIAETVDLGILVDHHRLTGCQSQTISSGRFLLVKRPSAKSRIDDGILVTSIHKVEVDHLAKAIRKQSKQRRDLKIEMEVVSWTLLKNFVLKTNSIGYVPDYIVHDELKSGKLVMVKPPGEPFEFEVKAAWNQARALRRNAALFLETLLESAR